jgi:CheY-like chemotaxis protein
MMPNVLIVDENGIRREMIAAMIRSLGCTVIQGDTGRDCIQKASIEEFDVIVMELRLPRMGGADTTTWLKSNALTRDIPVIIYGPAGARESRNEALRSGAVEVLSEPALSANLPDVLRKYLPKSQVR